MVGAASGIGIVCGDVALYVSHRGFKSARLTNGLLKLLHGSSCKCPSPASAGRGMDTGVCAEESEEVGVDMGTGIAMDDHDASPVHVLVPAPVPVPVPVPVAFTADAHPAFDVGGVTKLVFELVAQVAFTAYATLEGEGARSLLEEAGGKEGLRRPGWR